MKFSSLRELLSDDAARALSRLPADSAEHQAVAFLKLALEDRASDIHIEPRTAARCLIRRRIDGFLHELTSDHADWIHPGSIEIIKNLAKLDTKESAIPQQGCFDLKDQNIAYRAEVSILPLVNGEKIVIHLIPLKKEILNLRDLGMTLEQAQALEEKIQKPYGMIFIAGPAQNGLTMTAYSIVKRRMSPKVNILTLEDPVEQLVHGVNQVQVCADIGLTCAAGLRAFLRQDPDVVYVGAEHDEETLSICIRAALTGRMIISCLPAENAHSALISIMDQTRSMPGLLAESLTLIIGQRLVRKLCPSCKREHPLSPEERKTFGITAPTVYRAGAKGCEACRGTGYWGRVGIFEFLPIDDEIRSVIRKQTDPAEIQKIIEVQPSMKLFESGMEKVNRGVTSMEEVLNERF